MVILVSVQQPRKNSVRTQIQMRKFYAALFVVGLLTACTETVSDSEEEKVQQLVNKLDYKKSKKSKPNTEKLFIQHTKSFK